MNTSIDFAIPCFNGAQFIRETVLSCINQSLPASVIWVIDDCSTDDSCTILSELAGLDSRVRLIQNEANIGKPESLNRIIETTRADFLALIDQDDLCEPQRLERQLAFMRKDPQLGCSCGFIRYINPQGQVIGNGVVDNISIKTMHKYLSTFDPFGLFCPSVMMRAQVFEKSDLRFRAQFWPAEDLDLWNRIAESGWNVYAQPEFLVRYRIHSSSMVARKFRDTRNQYDFMRACLAARRKGDVEPSRTEFFDVLEGAPWISKINRLRKIESKGRYRQSGLYLSEGKQIRAFLSFVLSFILQPQYALPRLLQQLRSYRNQKIGQ